MHSSRATEKSVSQILSENSANTTVQADSQKNKSLQSLFEMAFIGNVNSGLSSNHPPSKTIEKPVLSQSELITLPRPLDNAAENTVLKNSFPKNLAYAIFSSLQKKTEQRLSLWKTISPPKQRLVSTEPDGRARNAIVLQRFNDVPLINNGAIEDPLRSERYGVKQFLHANLMDFSGGLQFIASQKPYKNTIENEISGFWTMVLQRKVPLIVDLTKPEEHRGEADYSFGKVRNCGTQECGPLTITLPENKATASARTLFARASGQVCI